MKSKKGLIASVVVAIIVLLALAGGLIYAKTDLFKPANKLFYKYLLGEKTKIDYDEILEQIKNSDEKEYSSNGEINVSVDTESTSTYARDNLNDVKKIKVEYEQKNKPQENKMSSNIKLSYDDKEAVNANIIKNADIYAVQSDMLNDKYIAVENNNLKELAKKLGMDEENIPDRIEQVNAYDLLYVSKEDRKEISNKYKEVINDKINKNNYTTEKNVETEVNGEKIKTKTYKLKITEKEIYETLKGMLETAKEDEKTQELLISKYEMLNKNAQNSEELTKDNIKENIEDLISNVDKKLKNATDDYINIVVYAYKGKTAKIEIQGENTISIEFFEKDNKNNINVLLKDTSDEYKLNVEYEVKKENDEKKAIGTITVLLNNEEKGKINYEISEKGTIGKGKNEIAAKFNVESNGSKIELNIKENINYDEKVTIEDIDSNNMSKLNDMSEDEINDLFIEVYQKVQTELPKVIEETGISELFNRSTNYITDSNNDEDSYDIEDEDYDTSNDDDEEYNYDYDTEDEENDDDYDYNIETLDEE